MSESAMTTVRLPVSFGLSLCTGAALFGLLHAMITVDRYGVIFDIVPDIEFRPVREVVCDCGSAPIRPRDKPRLVKPWLPPAMPAIRIGPWVESIEDGDRIEFEFQLPDVLGADVVI